MVADDNKWWVEVLYGVIAAFWAALAVLWGYVWKEVAMKGWVADKIKESVDEDVARDRQLIADLLAPVLIQIGAIKEHTDMMHRENRERLDEILRRTKRP